MSTSDGVTLTLAIWLVVVTLTSTAAAFLFLLIDERHERRLLRERAAKEADDVHAAFPGLFCEQMTTSGRCCRFAVVPREENDVADLCDEHAENASRFAS